MLCVLKQVMSLIVGDTVYWYNQAMDKYKHNAIKSGSPQSSLVKPKMKLF